MKPFKNNLPLVSILWSVWDRLFLCKQVQALGQHELCIHRWWVLGFELLGGLNKKSALHSFLHTIVELRHFISRILSLFSLHIITYQGYLMSKCCWGIRADFTNVKSHIFLGYKIQGKRGALVVNIFQVNSLIHRQLVSSSGQIHRILPIFIGLFPCNSHGT